MENPAQHPRIPLSESGSDAQAEAHIRQVPDHALPASVVLGQQRLALNAEELPQLFVP